MIHVGLNVTDLEKSIRFYEDVFEEGPVKKKQDYAKFMPAAVPVNFTLNKSGKIEGNQVGHFGIQLENKEDVMYHKKRLEEKGYFSRDEMNTTCCYALQDKFMITDPDGNEWEYFYTIADSEENHSRTITCCS
ncbi:ArsI/CadI family heavy metal resistance metalloenzyme [Alteribacillus bidgolensis]|uniref:Lactoylglutathione lyase n=1 Tax=Alteribacillus bidgolensis TaxID=930129 RepID=A0A1G8MQM0_9BACI|nr:ArsI/CadI family heavy metal resistance metalloenzyme [Alteribacillus bidgolensis]SDI70166.1 lactoylglutathione lyase [Alteribacillus bidgolensis]